jgi:hypothetical protein
VFAISSGHMPKSDRARPWDPLTFTFRAFFFSFEIGTQPENWHQRHCRHHSIVFCNEVHSVEYLKKMKDKKEKITRALPDNQKYPSPFLSATNHLTAPPSSTRNSPSQHEHEHELLKPLSPRPRPRDQVRGPDQLTNLAPGTLTFTNLTRRPVTFLPHA